MAKSAENRIEPKEILRIGGVLCIICAVIALILSFVNKVTLEKIAQNEEMEKRSAMVALFASDSIEYSAMEGAPETVDEIYKVSEGKNSLGYCISVSPAGFGGDLNMMVGIDSAGAVLGVRVVSHSETPGLGNRVENDSFLSQFVGKSGLIDSSKDIDIISGSTVSSKAVTEGVNAATAALAEILTGGAAN